MLEKLLEAAAITLLLKLMLAIGSSPYITQGTSLSHQIVPLAEIPNANSESAIKGERKL
jgi:hypothetical protein